MGPGRNVYIVPYGSHTTRTVRKLLSNKSRNTNLCDFKQYVFILHSQELNFKSSFFVLLMINKSLACRLPIPITVRVCILPKCVRGCWHLITRIHYELAARSIFVHAPGILNFHGDTHKLDSSNYKALVLTHFLAHLRCAH